MIGIDIILFLILLSLLVCYNKSNYVNYVDYQKPFQNYRINCPQNYSINYNQLMKYPKLTQPYGYSSNEYIDKTRFYQTDKPLPVDPDFFIY